MFDLIILDTHNFFLVKTDMHNFDVIIGKDLLVTFRAKIDCYYRRVIF